MTSSTNDKPPKPKGEGGGAGAMAKGILIMLLLIVGAGAGGYFFGTYQKFAPIQNVPPGTPGAQSSGSSVAVSNTGSSQLKKKYWLHSYGYDHVGFSITVLVNGQEAGQFFSDNKDVDVTKFVKPGENSIQFKAKLLPSGMREHAGESGYYLTLYLYSGNVVGQANGKEELLKYTRHANEFEDHDDTMTFLPIE